MTFDDEHTEEEKLEYLKFIKNWNEEHEESKAERLAPQKFTMPEPKHRVEVYVSAEQAIKIFEILKEAKK